MNNQRTKRIVIARIGPGSPSLLDLNSFLKQIEIAKAQAPKEYINDLKIDLYIDQFDEPRVDLSYVRPLSDIELASEKTDELRRKRGIIK